MRHTACMIRQWVCLIGLLVLTGCAAAPQPQPAGNSQDVILEAPEAQVRAAFDRVLTEGGYEVVVEEEEEKEKEKEKGKDKEKVTIRTDYREEISSYNWLYRTLFGVNRSKVTVTLIPENETSTRVSVQVMYKGKDGEWMPLTGSWVPYDAALPQSAANTIRLVKNELGLL